MHSGCWIGDAAVDTLIGAVSSPPTAAQANNCGKGNPGGSDSPEKEPAKPKAKETEPVFSDIDWGATRSPPRYVEIPEQARGTLRNLQFVALRVRGGVPAGKLAQLITAVGSTGVCTHLHLFAGVTLRSVHGHYGRRSPVWKPQFEATAGVRQLRNHILSWAYSSAIKRMLNVEDVTALTAASVACCFLCLRSEGATNRWLWSPCARTQRIPQGYHQETRVAYCQRRPKWFYTQSPTLLP